MEYSPSTSFSILRVIFTLPALTYLHSFLDMKTVLIMLHKHSSAGAGISDDPTLTGALP
jgi:hypothetical protein